MRIINKKYLVITLLVGVLLTGVIILKPKEEVKLDNVILKQEVNNKTFAMYKEEGNEYVPVNGTEFPEGYVLNIAESKCIDNNGNKLENVLSYENDKVTITSGNTTYCYLYFDKSTGLKIREQTSNGLSEILTGGMYRYYGLQNNNIENYICFGTNDKNKCLDSPDKYMYRIIGITPNGDIKIIKKTSIGWYSWHSNASPSIGNIFWPDSDIYKELNDLAEENIFIGNNNYEYMNDINWSNLIKDYDWTYAPVNFNHNALDSYLK